MVTGANTDIYGYDEAGQLKTRTRKGVSTTLTWSALNRVSSVKTGSDTTTYVYDAAGDVLLRNAPTEKVLYLDGHEIHKAGSAPAQASRYYTAGGTGLAVRTADSSTNGKLTWLLGDGQASTQLMVTAVGGAVTRRRYTPFGKQRGTTANLPSAVDRGFVGMPEDDSTGLSMLGARMYDASLGRFLSPDALSKPYSPQQVNAYSYSINNPVAYSDPSGLEIGSPPNSCRYDLKYCDKKTQDAVGYDPGTGKVDYTKGTAVGDGSIVKGRERATKLPKPVYNWMTKDLGYRGSQYLSKYEYRAWYNNAKGEETKARILTFHACLGEVGDAKACMSTAKRITLEKDVDANSVEEWIHKNKDWISFVNASAGMVTFVAESVAAGCGVFGLAPCTAWAMGIAKVSSGIAVLSRVPMIIDACGAYKESNMGCGEQVMGLVMDGAGVAGAYGATERIIRRFSESLVGTILPW